jgi:hypothetical protein
MRGSGQFSAIAMWLSIGPVVAKASTSRSYTGSSGGDEIHAVVSVQSSAVGSSSGLLRGTK